MIAISAPHIFDGLESHGEGVVLVEDGRIVGIAPEAPAGVPVDEWQDDTMLVPGYIDLQVNGGGGVMFNDETSVEGLSAIASAHARAGTTAILPTLISGTRDQLRAALAAGQAALAAKIPGIAGLHLEGPFLALARRGVHPAANITAMTEDDLAMLAAPFPAPLMVTLAPDAVSPDFIARLAQAGVVVFAGHTDATQAQAAAGIEAGITGFTHLYNAMSQLTGRQPGAVGAALTDGRVGAGIIADGHHVHATSLRVAFGMMGPDRLFLVSDAMATAASDIDRFVLNGETIRLVDGMLTNEAGTLAGAHLTMAEAVRNAMHLAGIPWTQAVRMATATPAAWAGLADRGRIAVGMRADILAVDSAFNVLATWQDGVRV